MKKSSDINAVDNSERASFKLQESSSKNLKTRQRARSLDELLFDNKSNKSSQTAQIEINENVSSKRTIHFDSENIDNILRIGFEGSEKSEDDLSNKCIF